MKRLLLFLSVLSLPAGALAQVDEREATERGYLDCLQRMAGQFDDQKTDVADVAKAIIPRCAGEYAAQKAAFGRLTPDPAAQQALFETMDGARIQTATGVVLKERQGLTSR